MNDPSRKRPRGFLAYLRGLLGFMVFPILGLFVVMTMFMHAGKASPQQIWESAKGLFFFALQGWTSLVFCFYTVNHVLDGLETDEPLWKYLLTAFITSVLCYIGVFIFWIAVDVLVPGYDPAFIKGFLGFLLLAVPFFTFAGLVQWQNKVKELEAAVRKRETEEATAATEEEITRDTEAEADAAPQKPKLAGLTKLLDASFSAPPDTEAFRKPEPETPPTRLDKAWHAFLTSDFIGATIMFACMIAPYIVYRIYGSIPSVLLAPSVFMALTFTASTAKSFLKLAEAAFPSRLWNYEGRVLALLAVPLYVLLLMCFPTGNWARGIVLFVALVALLSLRELRMKDKKEKVKPFRRFPGWKQIARGLFLIYFVLAIIEFVSSMLPVSLPPKYDGFRRKIEHPFSGGLSVVADTKGNVYVLIQQKLAVQKYDSHGKFLFSFPNIPHARRLGIAIDDQDRVFLYGYQVNEYNTEGRQIRTIASPSNPPKDSRYPTWRYGGNGNFEPVYLDSPPEEEHARALKPGTILLKTGSSHGFICADDTWYEAARRFLILRSVLVIESGTQARVRISPNPVSNLFSSSFPISFIGLLILGIAQTAAQKRSLKEKGALEAR